MPKLFHINICSAVLSTGKIVEDICKVALRHGWDTYTAWGRFAKPSVSKQIQVGNKLDTYIHYAAHKFFDREGLQSKKATRTLIHQMEEINPDIIHLHNIHDHYLNYPILFEFLAKLKKPVVWTQHDCWAFTGGCMYYDIHNCNKWMYGCNNCPEHRALLSDITEKQYVLKQEVFSKIKKLTYVSVSNWLEKALQKSHQKYRPIQTIHNGIDIELFKPVENYIPKNRFTIIGVAAVWDKRKGLDDFVKLRSLLSFEDYEIILVGLTQSQINNLPKGIIGCSRTTNIQELVQIYSKADVYVNPTYSDNFPTTNIEALACGTPVITYQTGGAPEAIDANTGAVVEKGNIEALCALIKHFRIIDFKKNHSADCRKRAEDNFDKEKCFEKYIRLYESLLSCTE